MSKRGDGILHMKMRMGIITTRERHTEDIMDPASRNSTRPPASTYVSSLNDDLE